MNRLTFDQDLIGGFKEFADRLDKFISIERNYVDGSLVIAISAKFGSGKSTFLQMWASSLEQHNDEARNFLVVQLNAWESDYLGEPLFAIISELILSIKAHADEKYAASIISAAKDVGWFFTAIGGQVAKKFSGIDPAAAAGFAEKKKATEEDDIPTDAFSVYESRKKAMDNLKNSVNDFVKNNNFEVLFFIDELDRCRPDYAISYLETIKHIFDIKGATFLLAADRQQLENSAKKAFGSKLDFDEYYRKFIHREITLPTGIDNNGYMKLIERYEEKYLRDEEVRCCFSSPDKSFALDFTLLAIKFKLTLRQLQEVFRILGHLLAINREKNVTGLMDRGEAVFMALLKVGSSNYYNLLGTKQIAPKEALELLNGLLGHDDAKHWFVSLLFGGVIKTKKRELLTITTNPSINEERLNRVLEEYKEILNEVGLLNPDSSTHSYNPLDHLRGLLKAQGIRLEEKTPFIEAYNKIEKISNWN